MSGTDQQVPSPAAEHSGLTSETLSQLLDVMDRHGARVRRSPDQDGNTYSTVYRSAVLQIPAQDIAGRPSLVDEVNRILAATGHRLVAPDGPQSPGFPQRAHRRVQLASTTSPAGGGAPADPADAWEALRVLRESVRRDGVDQGLRDAVDRIELEHLLFGATVTPPQPDPSTEGHPATVSFPWPGSGDHTPVMLVGLKPPERRPLNAIPGGRRPLIAVLDTGIGQHPWLRDETGSGDADSAGSGAADAAGDAFVVDDAELQALIDIDEIDDGPEYGHGTFIAGIVRQACPDARVLNIRVMHDDGVIREHDLTLALAALLERNQAIQADLAAGKEADTSKFVDVVSLSAGYYPESSERAYTTRLLALLKELSECGVLIVASAGNDSTDARCYPAGMEFDAPDTPLDEGKPPVVLSVGALDPDGERAPFSNYGPWVTSWATGAALISTMPTTGAAGSAADNGLGYDDARKVLIAAQTQPPRDHLLHGPDRYGSGFALWSGTSFAAPLVAAQLASALLAGAGANGELSLGQVGQKATLERARAAFAAVRAERAERATSA